MLGVVLGTIIAFSLYYYGKKEIQPRYAVGVPELLAEVTEDAPKLRLLWDNVHIKNVYSVKIAIWNEGRQYLDNDAISKTSPIRVICPQQVELLYHRFIKTSRSELEFRVTDISSEEEKILKIELVGDEALERGDGGILKLLFSGKCNGFEVVGRIKGAKAGFERIEWKDIAFRKSKTKLALATFSQVLVIVLSCAFLFSRVSRMRVSEANLVHANLVHANLVHAIFIGVWAAVLVSSGYVLYITWWPLLFGLPWAV